MSSSKEYVTFTDFYQLAYDAAMTESFMKHFKEVSKIGNQQEMVKCLMSISCIADAKITESYSNKDDIQALRHYEKSFAKNLTKDRSEEESSACNSLVKALFAASVSSQLYLDALLGCAKHWYNLNAFAKSLKYCECMLALPPSLYNQTVEDSSYFIERRKECAQLKLECSKKLDMLTSQSKRKGKRNNAAVDSMGTKDSNRLIPVIKDKPHATLKSCSNAVTLQFAEERGRHLVATRDIKAGSILIIDQPFSFTMEKEALDRNCLHCYTTLVLDSSIRIPCRYCQRVSFCTEKCRNEAWLNYHQYECSVFDLLLENNCKQRVRKTSYLLLAYRTTVTAALSSNMKKECNTLRDSREISLNPDFLRYHGVHGNNVEEIQNIQSDLKKLGVSEVYDSLDYRTILGLNTHSADMEPMINLVYTIEAIFLAKCMLFVLDNLNVMYSNETFTPIAIAMLRHLQLINSNAYEIVENVRDKTTHVWDPRYVGGAIYPTVSLVNHSCHPNIVRHNYPSGQVVVRSLRLISKGTEILDCYGPHFLNEGRLEIRECATCGKRVDYKRLQKQLRESIQKRIRATNKMYQGQYEEALPLLLEHIQFIETFFAAPNIEGIKTQQCIIQCYNSFSCISQ
ncbi:hypothetical protein KM043_004671 [Ampulex compressa]|nr:hypothetical protein KM043_004671 [Ampulex compressa]